MSELSKEDKKVVKRWWKCCAMFILDRGYNILDKYSPSLTPSHLPETCRSFQEIVNAGTIISVTAKRRDNKRSVKLTIVVLRGVRDEGNAQEQDVAYFDVPANPDTQLVVGMNPSAIQVHGQHCVNQCTVGVRRGGSSSGGDGDHWHKTR
ncbi:hypothetical protein EI94DRAFT_101940 [Lactarius quietus]|nr:hypothetical protein EI94DRAFT_101940 [Lactarius quietus]